MTIIRIVKQGTKWAVKNGCHVLRLYRVKTEAVDYAFYRAERLSPAKVRIYSASGHMQVESNW